MVDWSAMSGAIMRAFWKVFLSFVNEPVIREALLLVGVVVLILLLTLLMRKNKK